MFREWLRSKISLSSTEVAPSGYFGQEAEDAVLAELFGAELGRKGFFVDVGAHHPTRYSNTWKFYQLGWRGINIDPTPGCMVEFNKLRPEDTNLEIGVSAREAERSFYCYNEPALNGIDNDRREELAESPYKLEKIIEVRTKPLSDILSAHGVVLKSPNFLSIDVEGLEMEVLQSSSWDRYLFEWILIEQRANDLTTIDQTSPWLFLSSKGYQAVACTGRTVIYKVNTDIRVASRDR
jgi:FkbM family methyltransferase